MPSLPLKFHLQSVRGRLFLLIVALVIPAVGIISALSWEAYRAQQQAVRAELSNTARAVAGVVDAEVDRSVAMLQTFLATRSLRERDWDMLDSTARRVLPDSKRWLVVADMHGHQIINTRLPRGVKLPDVTPDAAYGEAMRKGEIYVSNVMFGPVANGLVVHISLPFRHESGELYGLGVVTTPEMLSEFLGVGRLAPQGVMSILDREGRIVVRNRNQQEFAGAPATPDIVKATRENQEGVGESVTLERIPVLTAFSRAKCGWSVAIGTPKARVLESARRLFFMALGCSLLVTLTAIACAAWIGRVVVRGVDGLAEDAERLARGEPLAAGVSDLEEINVVGEAMRRMAAKKSETEAQLREARDHLQRYAQELESRVEERTASLREAVTQMEEFSYTISHDLRGPLRAINGFAVVLLEDCGPQLDEQSRDYLQRIVRASDRMNRLTSDLLNYSRVVRADLERSRVQLEPLLRALLEQYTELHPSVTEVTLVTPLHDVRAHEASLAQALTNLLTNAAKFVKPGERPHIRVRTERHERRVKIWVEDDGIGIPPEYQERLFRIFERMPGARGYEGTGVGLAIVRKIAEKTGGTCGVESDGRNGSHFWLELEAADATTPEAAAVEKPISVETSSA